MIKYYQVGKYEQMIKLNDYGIIGISCTCMYSTIHPRAWETGDKLCRHLCMVLEILKGNKENTISTPKISKGFSEEKTNELNKEIEIERRKQNDMDR